MWFDHKFHLQFLQDIVHTMLQLSQPFFFDFFHDGEGCKNGAQDLIYKKLRMKFHNPNCIFEEIYNIRSELLDVNHHHRINGGNIVYRHFEQMEDTGYKLVKAHIYHEQYQYQSNLYKLYHHRLRLSPPICYDGVIISGKDFEF